MILDNLAIGDSRLRTRSGGGDAVSLSQGSSLTLCGQEAFTTATATAAVLVERLPGRPLDRVGQGLHHGHGRGPR